MLFVAGSAIWPQLLNNTVNDPPRHVYRTTGECLLASNVDAKRLVFSEHVVAQARKRGISLDMVPYIVSHGERYYHDGGVWYWLRRKDIDESDRRRFERYAGVTVMIAPESTIVVTTFRLKRNKRDQVLRRDR